MRIELSEFNKKKTTNKRSGKRDIHKLLQLCRRSAGWNNDIKCLRKWLALCPHWKVTETKSMRREWRNSGERTLVGTRGVSRSNNTTWFAGFFLQIISVECHIEEGPAH